MEQKIIQIGSSAGVTISPETLKALGMQVGDIVKTEVNNESFIIKARPTPQVKLAGDTQFAAWLEDAVERYRPALEALKNA